MTPISEERVIQEKMKELNALVEQREQIQAKISKVEQAIKAFIALLDDEMVQGMYSLKLSIASRPLGLTDSIKLILLSANSPLTAAEVRDALVERGFPLSGYSNPLSVIYTTLNRSAKKNEDGTYEPLKEPEQKRGIAHKFASLDVADHKRAKGQKDAFMGR